MSLFKKQGGSFAGKLTSLTFESKDWDGNDGKKGYSTITAKLEIEKDGADEAIEQYLPAGFFYPNDGQTISEDGETLEGGAQVGEDSEFARFVASAVEKGAVSETDLLDEDGNGTNFSALVGNRYEFGREINKDRQMAAGKKKLGKKAATSTDDEIMKAGRQQDKKDKTKFYNHTFLVVSSVLGAAKAEKAVDKGTKAVSTKSTKTTNGSGKKSKDAEQDFDAADALLVDLLADAKKPVKKSGLSSLVVRHALAEDMADDTRDGFRKLFGDDEYLGRENGWSFDSKSKDKMVSLEA